MDQTAESATSAAHRVPTVDLPAWLQRRFGGSKRAVESTLLILKMDIEGGELTAMPPVLNLAKSGMIPLTLLAWECHYALKNLSLRWCMDVVSQARAAGAMVLHEGFDYTTDK